MGKDILVILMIAFGLCAIFMFILFFIYLKKYYNNRHIDDNYQKDLDDKFELEAKEVEIQNNEYDSDMEFTPIKKK